MGRPTRRQFLGGVTSLVAASAYSLSVPARTAGQVTGGDSADTQTVTSPDGTISVTVHLADGSPSYRVSYGGREVLTDSSLGFAFQNQPAFGDGLTVTGSERSNTDETWQPIWDRYDEIRERYTELRLGLAETSDTGRALTLEVRVFNDGVGFRYVFPADSGFGDFVISSEYTEFAFPADHTAWWITNDPNSYEYPYEETAVSEIGPESDFGGAHTPLTLRSDDGLYLSVHEANLLDYAAMSLEPVESGVTTLQSELAPLPDGTKVTASTPHRTPWRTIQLGERPGDLIESSLIVNLNEDFDPTDFPQGTDWIEPRKFVGIWWLMITGRADWEYQGPETGNHAAQTGRAKQYMDFASEHDIPGVLVEGWNEGWSSYPEGGGGAFDFTDPYPDFDLGDVTSYGPSLDPSTQMVMHNETAGGFRNYEAQIDEAFGLYDDLGIRAIKNGYVRDAGDLGGEGHNHHNQVMVNHHHLVAQTAAENRQLLDIHEPVHPTGRRRRFPNLMTREGVYGQEYDAFGDIPPSHHVTFPFTRMLAGPVEFTPGIFDMDSGSGGIETTRAKQLAMYPTYFSGLQMVADLPSSYLADRPATIGLDEVAQAEFGDLDGLGTAASWSHAQGERYVEFDPNSVDPGSTVTWELDDVDPGEYALHLRYASDVENNAVPADVDRTATVLVGGQPATQGTVEPTAYWDEWTTIATTVEIEGDDESIGVALTDADTGGFNLDSIALTAPGESMPDPETPPIRGPTVEAFQFVEDVPAAGWDDTCVLDAAIGDYTVVARKKDDEWYLGAMTDESGRAIDVDLEFLSPRSKRGRGKGKRNGNGRAKNGPQGPKYVAEIYSDGIEARYDETLDDVRVDEAIVTPGTTLLASMVGSGGTAVRLRRARGQEINDLPEYERPDQDVSIAIDEETFIREPFMTATGSNDGEFIGGTTIEILVDGEVVRTTNVRFPPNTTDAVDELSYSIADPGTYDVLVRTTDGETLASRTVTVNPPAPVATIDDPIGDDYGPGAYTYPTADAFRKGAFDLTGLGVAATPSLARFTIGVETLYDVFGGRFSPHMFVIWLRDPTVSGGTTGGLSDIGANVTFEQPWHYRLRVDGWNLGLVDAGGSPVTDESGSTIAPDVAVDFEAGTVTLDVDRAAFDGTDIADLEVVGAVGSENFGVLRSVQPDASAYIFGGAKSDAVDNAPLLIDVTTPSGVSQAAALAYDATERATLPFVPLGDG